MSKPIHAGLIALICLCGACHRTRISPVAPVQGSPDQNQIIQFRQAEAYFSSGDYERAKAAYQKYLEEYPTAEDTDHVWLRLALIAANDEGYTQANAILQRLLERFPLTTLRTEATLILTLTARVSELELQLARSEEEIARSSKGLPTSNSPLMPPSANREKESKSNDDALKRAVSERDQLRAQVRRLTDELNALKKIDIERHPSPTPR